MTDLFTLIEKNEIDQIESVLEKSPLKVNDYNDNGYTPLVFAVQQKNHNAIKRLLSSGADPNQVTNKNSGTYYGYTAVHFAAKVNDSEILQMLHVKGGNLKYQAQDGWSPLHVACFNKAPESVKWLVEKKVDLNVLNEHKLSPIISLVSHGKTDALRIMIKAGADLEIKDLSGDTLMHHAFHVSMHKLFENSYNTPEIQIDVAVCLALYGVDPSKSNKDNVLPTFYFVKEMGSDLFPKVLQLLYMNGEKILSSEGSYAERWNYMTLLTVKNRQIWENLGIHPQQAKDLVDYMQQFEAERLKKKENKNKKPEPKKRTTPLQKIGDDDDEDEDEDEEEVSDNENLEQQKKEEEKKTFNGNVSSKNTNVIGEDKNLYSKDIKAEEESRIVELDDDEEEEVEETPEKQNEKKKKTLDSEQKKTTPNESSAKNDNNNNIVIKKSPIQSLKNNAKKSFLKEDKKETGKKIGLSSSEQKYQNEVQNEEEKKAIFTTKKIQNAKTKNNVEDDNMTSENQEFYTTNNTLLKNNNYNNSNNNVTERVVEKIVEVKWYHPSTLPPPVLDAGWVYHNRAAILCCIICFLLGNSFGSMRC